MKQQFARHTLDLMSEVVASDALVEHTVRTFAELFEHGEHDLTGVMRSHYINLADPEYAFPADLVRIAGLVGLGAEPGMATEVFRERLRLFIQAYLQGAGTPQSILTMAAAELGVLLGGPAHRHGTQWIQPVRRLGNPPDLIRLEENPIYRVEKQPVLAKTGTRWTIDSPGMSGESMVYPQVTIEALVNDVRGPSIILETIGLAWLSPSVVLHRGEQLILRVDDDGRFFATKHSHAGVQDVTAEIELVGRVPDVDELDRGIRLAGGDEVHQATALVKSSNAPRVVRLSARSPGRWGNGLSVRRAGSEQDPRLLVMFDPMLASTGEADAGSISQWTVAAPGDVLATTVARFEPGRFLLEAEDATLFLPGGRSHWMYLDHLSVRTEDGSLRNLARLLLDYTRFDHAVHHNTDTFAVFRLDRDETRFDDAIYTREEERVQVTFSWLEPRPTAIRLEVPTWIESEADEQARTRAYQRLADGIRRIKPAGVAASVIRSLPTESLAISEVFPEHVSAQLSERAVVNAEPAASVNSCERVTGADSLVAARDFSDTVSLAATMMLEAMTVQAASVTEESSAGATLASAVTVTPTVQGAVDKEFQDAIVATATPSATGEAHDALAVDSVSSAAGTVHATETATINSSYSAARTVHATETVTIDSGHSTARTATETVTINSDHSTARTAHATETIATSDEASHTAHLAAESTIEVSEEDIEIIEEPSSE